MTWTPRTARAVVGVATLCVLGSVGPLGAGAAAAAGTPTAERTTTTRNLTSLPRSFSFDGMSPGQTRSTIVDLSSVWETDGTVVDVAVTATGELGTSLATTIEACGTAWVDDECPTGAVVLVDGWRTGRSGSSHQELVLPAGETASLRVSVTLDEDVRAGATGNVRYDLSFEGARPGGEETGDGSEGGATGTTGPSAPDDAAGSGASPGPGSGSLAATGTGVLTLAGLAGALLGIGAALVRRRRRDTDDEGATARR